MSISLRIPVDLLCPGAERRVQFVGLQDFRFAEPYSLQIRLDASNFLNHVNFYEPNINVNVAAGGTIPQADGPRKVQLAARWNSEVHSRQFEYCVCTEQGAAVMTITLRRD